MSKRSVLQIGDVLYIDDPRKVATSQSAPGVVKKSAAAEAAAAPGPVKVVHTVRRGQNPSTIAKRYGVPVRNLFEWNDWSKAPVLQIGDEIIVMTSIESD